MSCLQKHTEFVRRKKHFTLNWCPLVAWVRCLQINTEIVQKTNQLMFKWICMVPLCAGLWVSCLQINLKESSSFLACVAIVSVRSISKERGTRVNCRAKNGSRFIARSKPKIPFLGLLCSETKLSRLYIDIYRITFNEKILIAKTLHYWLYSIFVSASEPVHRRFFFLLENRRTHDHDSVALVTSFAISNSTPLLVKTSLEKTNAVSTRST